MRHWFLLTLLLLIVLPACHHTKKLHRSKDVVRTREKTVVYNRKEEPKKYTPESYIETWKEVAIKQMHKYGVPASITLAQALLESANGNSTLAREANNHFGIKCTNDWTGGTYYKKGDTENDCFRKYKNTSESFADHCEFLKKGRYAGLYKLKRTDYKGWARGLKEAGYATNPKYPQLLINMVEKYNLGKYDR